MFLGRKSLVFLASILITVSLSVAQPEVQPYPIYGYLRYSDGSHPSNPTVIGRDVRSGDSITIDFEGCREGSCYHPPTGFFQLEFGNLPNAYEDGDRFVVEIDDGEGNTLTIEGVISLAEGGYYFEKVTLEAEAPETAVSSTTTAPTTTYGVDVVSVSTLRKAPEPDSGPEAPATTTLKQTAAAATTAPAEAGVEPEPPAPEAGGIERAGEPAKAAKKLDGKLLTGAIVLLAVLVILAAFIVLVLVVFTLIRK